MKTDKGGIKYPVEGRNKRSAIVRSIAVSLGVLATAALLFSTVPAQAATLGQLTVITVPGTDIYVNGVFAAHNFAYYRNITLAYPGVYTITVTKPKYYPKTATVTLSTKVSSIYIGALTYRGW